MKLQILRYFVEIIESGNFTKAAKACYVTQPALSRAIHELEEELDCPLFERKGRKLVLTDPGKICYKEAKIILEQCQELKEKVHGKTAQPQTIKVGYLVLGHLLYFQNYIEQHNLKIEGSLETFYGVTNTLKEKLINQELDLILLTNACIKSLPQLERKILMKTKLHVLVARNHPLYHKESLCFDDLRNEKIIGWDEVEVSFVARSYIEAFQKHGIEPNIVAQGKKTGDLVTLMAQHQAISLMLPVSCMLPDSEFKTIPILDSDDEYGLCMFWKKENKNPILKRLISHL